MEIEKTKKIIFPDVEIFNNFYDLVNALNEFYKKQPFIIESKPVEILNFKVNANDIISCKIHINENDCISFDRDKVRFFIWQVIIPLLGYELDIVSINENIKKYYPFIQALNKYLEKYAIKAVDLSVLD